MRSPGTGLRPGKKLVSTLCPVRAAWRSGRAHRPAFQKPRADGRHRRAAHARGQNARLFYRPGSGRGWPAFQGHRENRAPRLCAGVAGPVGGNIMNGLLETRKLWITPLSPVHMGTDQDYVPTNYVIEGDALYEFDDRALENLPDSERRALNNLLDGKARPEMLKNVQAFFHRNRECLIPAAVNVIRVSHEMAALYESRVGKAANIESSGKQILNALEIQRAFHNPIDRRLILPGSGLKGAMRTALLDKINDGRPSQGKEKNRELQQRLFQYTLPELHKDPLRLLQVGDCAWRGPDAINSAEVLFAVNRKKRPVRENGQELLSRAEQQNLYQLLECAAPFRFRAFQGWLNIMQTKGAGRQTDRLPALRFSFAELASACNRFYRPIFDCEIELLRKRGMLDTQWREIVEAWLGNENIQRRLRDNNAFLLRAGRHSGAESVTLNGVRSIRIMKGKGQEPAFEPEAKTIWLARRSISQASYKISPNKTSEDVVIPRNRIPELVHFCEEL
ncbi:MAG TPA: hypothetical protein EYP90_09745, partial [Chromatiaceae bacterium]|nr:hypothetical protein [Chromatiaceae bacterium]